MSVCCSRCVRLCRSQPARPCFRPTFDSARSRRRRNSRAVPIAIAIRPRSNPATRLVRRKSDRVQRLWSSGTGIPCKIQGIKLYQTRQASTKYTYLPFASLLGVALFGKEESRVIKVVLMTMSGPWCPAVRLQQHIPAGQSPPPVVLLDWNSLFPSKGDMISTRMLAAQMIKLR